MRAQEQKIGRLILKNKFIMAPVKTGYGTMLGEVTQRHIRYYQRRAHGGTAMIICEPFFIHPSGKELPTQIGIHDNLLIPGLQHLVNSVHEKGAKICAHLNHAGRAANPKLVGDMLMAPSAVTCPSHGQTPKVMSADEIEQSIIWFAQAAQRAVDAGFDAIEIQFGLGYLAHQFFSRHTNKRQDIWQQPLRYSEKMVQAVRAKIGDAFPILARISGSEFVEGGTAATDAIALAKNLENLGVNALHLVNGSACDSPPVYYQFFTLPEGQNIKSAQNIKAHVKIPVIATGRIGDPADIRRLYTNGKIDFIGLGRPLVADPDLPNKILSDQDDAVIRCGYCLQGCLSNVKALKGLRCVVNPEVGNAEERQLTPVSAPRKVAVIGAGPAGIKAALTAEARGHRVDLYEKESFLGGQFALSFLAPAKKGMKILYDDLVLHLSRSGVRVHLNSEMDPEKILSLKVDSVILASGARPKIVPFKGLDSRTYFNGFSIYRFNNWDTVNKAVVIGGGLIGMEAAEFISKKNIETTVIEILPQVAGDMEMISKKLLLKRISELPVVIHTQAQVQSIESSSIHYLKDGIRQSIQDVDLLVIATGTEPINDLQEPLVEAGVAVTLAGDMVQPAKIFEAIHSGFSAGMNV